jgi:hypothetical protein
VWIAIGTETGYVNHTSSTAVRTDVALAHPFPDERVSEDAHTWLRYSAGGARFAYLDAPWSAYRATTDEAGSSSRTREEGNARSRSNRWARRERCRSKRPRSGWQRAVGVVSPGRAPTGEPGALLRFERLPIGKPVCRSTLDHVAYLCLGVGT